MPDCAAASSGGRAQPVDWSTGCADDSLYLDSLQWSTWGAPAANATGIVHYRICSSSCDSVPVIDYPVELTATNIRSCASPLGYASFYTTFTVVIAFPEGNAAGYPPGRDAPRTFGAQCDPTFLVKLHGRRAAFGSFEETWDDEASNLETAFGPPASRKYKKFGCISRWPAMGLRVSLWSLTGHPCGDEAFFGFATLRSPIWQTAAGIHPGGPAAKARKTAISRCNRRKYTCGYLRHGYVLSKHFSDCAASRVPSVVAATEGGKVTELRVFTYGCE